MTELEKMQRAKMYIDKLANGIDPLTDTEMTEDKVLNQVRISRCLFYVSEVLGKVIDNGGEIGKKVYVKQQPFYISDEQLSRVEISEDPVGVSIIANRISAVLDENVKKVSAVQISGWLLNEGYLTENIYSGKKRKVTTSKGEMLGIFTVDGINSNNIPYKKNIYDKNAQQFVISHIREIENEEGTQVSV